MTDNPHHAAELAALTAFRDSIAEMVPDDFEPALPMPPAGPNGRPQMVTLEQVALAWVRTLADQRDEAEALTSDTYAALLAAKAEVDRLTAIVDAAHYVTGPPGCVEADMADVECPEYFNADGTSKVRLCSHADNHYATVADVYARERLEELLTELLQDLRRANHDDTEAVLTAVTEGVYAIAQRADECLSLADARVLNGRQPYKTVVDQELADLRRRRAERVDG